MSGQRADELVIGKDASISRKEIRHWQINGKTQETLAM